MHTLHFDPRQRLLIGLVALLATLAFVLVAAAPLDRLDVGADRGSRGAAWAPTTTAPAAPTTPAPASEAVSRDTPRWINDPLAWPLESLARPKGG